VSNSDSFIEEVTEEVRREKLYGYLRRYGWIGIVLVLLVVGGAAFNEYRKASARAQAQAFGDALFAAIEETDKETRLAALQSVQAPESGLSIARLLTSVEAASDGDGAANLDAARAGLEALAADSNSPDIYRDMARLRLLFLGDTVAKEDRLALIGALDVGGRPFRLLAREQHALILISDGATDDALEKLQSIIRDAETSQGQRQRATQLVVALGAEPDEG